MSDIIQLLPDNIANQIAAGEVVQRPASVVKELMENALDAGAKNIKVILKGAGRTLIQVIDDGCGMSETDARLAFERHATSKIRKAEDLFHIITMGFRGEALASVASVAQVELKTRREDKELGVHLQISASKVEKQEITHCPVGSNFIIKNLFFNIPARRKFLKQNSTELRHIVNEFQRVALVREDIGFELVSDNSQLYKLPPSSRLQRITNIFGKKIAGTLVSLKVSTSVVNLSGFVGTLDSVKRNKEQFFFTNGRYMRHPYLHKAVTQAYENLIPAGTHPSYFIYFDLDPENIDVNIHPTKTEIKFEEERNIWPILMAAVREALGKSNELPSIVFDQTDKVNIPVLTQDTVVSTPQIEVDPNFNPFLVESHSSPSGSGSSSGKNKSSRQHEISKDWETLYTDFNSNTELPPSEDLESPQSESLQIELPTPDTQTLFQPTTGSSPEGCGNFFQLHNKYILTSAKSGLMMIHQHRAHVRVLHERYMQLMVNERILSQGLLFPETLNLGAADVNSLKEINQELKFLGFDINYGTTGDITINGIPGDLKEGHISSVIDHLLDVVKNKAGDVRSELRESLSLTIAKSAAIQTGKRLSNEEMSKLFNELFACNLHSVTPDGKTIVWILKNELIEQGFRRS